MDLEGLARVLDEETARGLIGTLLRIYKGDNPLVPRLVETVIEEVRNSRKAESYHPLLRVEKVGAKAGESGLGSRGFGDHLIHSYVLKMSGGLFEDAGIVDDLVVSVDGIHSRLSYFPFFAGFHATRAALRDVAVKGAKPLGVLVDIHLADDADLSYLFEFEAGVLAVVKALNVRVLAGSTLRIGGDMVIGERISGGVGAVGKLVTRAFLRTNAKKGQHLVMTEGRGGGTITATAIFNGVPEVALRTITLSDVITAVRVSESLSDKVTAMTDVTNGGIRADAVEISSSTGLSVVLDTERFLKLIDPVVAKMLEALNVDPLGLSIDSILMATDNPDDLINALKSFGVRSDVVGQLEEWKGSPLIDVSGRSLDYPFRESAYTPIKKVIGNYTPLSRQELEDRVAKAYELAMRKLKTVLKTLKVDEPLKG
ncbi:MAG: AIR synthase related protein [Thermoprotei archaeon]